MITRQHHHVCSGSAHPVDAGHPGAALHAARLLDQLPGSLLLLVLIRRLDVLQSGSRKQRRTGAGTLHQRGLGSHFLPGALQDRGQHWSGWSLKAECEEELNRDEVR